MLAELKEFVKTHLSEILLSLLIVLISLFSFAVGYLTANQQAKESFRVENLP